MQIEACTDTAGMVRLLTAAFASDPGMRYLCAHQNDGYELRLAAWFEAMVRLQQANGQPCFTATCAGEVILCAVLTSPNAVLKPPSLLRWMWDVTRSAGFNSLWRTLKHLRRISSYQPPTPHFRLEFIAVAPAHQGKGYARLMLEQIHTLAQASADAPDVWLETANPGNIPLYERFGYVTKAAFHMSDSAKVTIMVRDGA